MSAQRWKYLYIEQAESNCLSSPQILLGGNDDSLIRFVYAYCECIKTILKRALFKTQHATQIASTNILVPNKKIQEELDTKSVANLALSQEIQLNISSTPAQDAANNKELSVAGKSILVPDTTKESPV